MYGWRGDTLIITVYKEDDMGVVDRCHDGGVLGIGNPSAEIMFIGIAPGRDEWMRTKQPFTGPSGNLLNGLLKLVDLHRDDVYLTNLLCWWKDSPDPDDIAKCLPRLIKEIKTIKPKVIYLLGKIVSETLLPEYKFGTMRGGAFWHRNFNCWVISTNHPSAYFDRGGQFAEIHDGVRDIRKAQIYANAPKDFGHFDYTVMGSLDDCNNMLQHISNHEDEVAIDVETYYDKSGMLSIAFACEHGTYHIPREFIYGPNYAVLKNSVALWTFHNGQFDSQQIRKWFDGLLLPIREDTMLMSYTLDERAGSDTELEAGGDEHSVGIHGLKRLAREYCGAEFYSETIGKKDDPIDQLTPERLAFYNSGDAAYTYRLVKYFKPLQIADGVREVYETLLIPAANTFRDINDRGCYIDRKALKELAREWLPRWLNKEKELLAQAHNLGWPAEEINTNSHKQLSTFIYDILLAPQIGVGKMARSTAKPIVEKMVADYPDHPASRWLSGLLEWRGLDRDINTYIKSVEELMDKKHFIHPEGLLHGTRNGRAAYHNPPVQTIPKKRTVGEDRARIRRIFAAAPPSERGTGERLLMEADLKQAELWVSYFVTGDQQMYEDLCSGDFHARVAEANWGITKQNAIDDTHWEHARDSSKRIVYGITYGAGADTLAEGKKLTGASGANYLFLATREDAQEAIDGYLARYHVFHAWREAEKRIVGTEGEQVSRTGRKRRYYMIQSYKQLNQAINTPISSFSHDFILASMIELHPLLAEFDAYINYEVHDSIVIDFPKQYIEEVSALVTNVMTKPRWGSPCGIPVDIKCGPNWFDVHDIEEVKKELVAT